MSATILSHQPKAAPSVLYHQLTASDRVSAAALALADVAGYQWVDLAPTQMQRFREMALFGALVAINDETADLAGYVLQHGYYEGGRYGVTLGDIEPRLRRAGADRLVKAIRFAGECLFGLHLDVLAEIRRLRDADREVR